MLSTARIVTPSRHNRLASISRKPPPTGAACGCAVCGQPCRPGQAAYIAPCGSLAVIAVLS